MKKTILILAFVFSLSKIFAQDGGTTGPELSLGINVGLPIGDFSQACSVGFGGTAKFAYNFTTSTAATLEAGYMSFSGKTINGFKIPAFNFVPIKAGFRYSLESGVYFEPQLGITSVSASGGGSTSGFTYAMNVGYRMTSGLDISGRYEAVSNDGTLSFFGVRLAYSFSLGGGR